MRRALDGVVASDPADEPGKLTQLTADPLKKRGGHLHSSGLPSGNLLHSY